MTTLNVMSLFHQESSIGLVTDCMFFLLDLSYSIVQVSFYTFAAVSDNRTLPPINGVSHSVEMEHLHQAITKVQQITKKI
jgi:hypothetical protein